MTALQRQMPLDVSMPRLVFGKILALFLAVVVVLSIASFPVRPIEIGILLALYAGAMLYKPSLWLFVLPAALPVFDLAPWSGRFFWDEFDFLILATLACSYWSRAYVRPFPAVRSRGHVLMHAMLISGAISLGIGLYSLPQITPHDWYDYLSPLNGFRVAKGLFWAWLLFPLLEDAFRVDHRQASKLAISGVLSGLMLCGLTVLWERGFFVSLIEMKSIYGPLGSLLDFSTNLRATGWFSSMHTGGSAIDGYLALAVPVAIAAFFLSETDRSRCLILVVLGFGLYAAIATFSRGLYGAVGLGLAVCLVAILRQSQVSARSLLRYAAIGVATLGVASLMQLLLFRSGGFQAIVLGMMLILCGLVAGFGANTRGRIPALLLALATAAGVTVWLHDAIVVSRYSDFDSATAGLIAGAGAVLLAGPGYYLGRHFVTTDRLVTTATILAFCGLMWVVGLPAVAGYRMTARFDASEKDLGTRQDHWRRSIEAMPSDIVSFLFGAGSGSFPRYYFFYEAQGRADRRPRESLKSYRFADDPETGGHLTLGTGGFSIQQRVDVTTATPYRISLMARSAAGPSAMNIRVCEKNIIFSSDNYPNCVGKRLHWKSDGNFNHLSADLDIGKVGRHGHGYLPVTLILANGNSDKSVDVTNIQLQAPDGADLVQNGRFDEAGDYWFFASDFEHLAWHPKNMFLFMFFEQGALGLIAFLLMFAAGIVIQFRRLGMGDTLAVVILPCLISLAAVGIFGTILDTPRVATFAYLLILAGVAPLPVVAREMQSNSAPTGEPVRTGNDPVRTEHRQKIQLYHDQYKFVKALSRRLDRSFSEVIQGIINTTLEEMPNEQLRLVISGREPKAQGSAPRISDRLRSVKIKIGTDQLAALETAMDELNVSASRSIRRMVAHFMNEQQSAGGEAVTDTADSGRNAD